MPKAATADLEVAEVEPIEEAPPEVWEAEAQSSHNEKVAMNLEAIMALPEVEARIAAVASQAASMAVAQAMGLGGPAKTMQSKVHDRFVTEANGSGDILAHFRCDNAVATKIVEMDMDLYEEYTSGEREVPRDEKGRRRSVIGLCSTPGKYITFVDGHCYAYTENQVKQLEWLQNHPPAQGGMPGIYRDYGEATSTWGCDICEGQGQKRSFSDRRTWEEHRARTHGIAA